MIRIIFLLLTIVIAYCLTALIRYLFKDLNVRFFNFIKRVGVPTQLLKYLSLSAMNLLLFFNLLNKISRSSIGFLMFQERSCLQTSHPKNQVCLSDQLVEYFF